MSSRAHIEMWKVGPSPGYGQKTLHAVRSPEMRKKKLQEQWRRSAQKKQKRKHEQGLAKERHTLIEGREEEIKQWILSKGNRVSQSELCRYIGYAESKKYVGDLGLDLLLFEYDDASLGILE